MTAVKAHTRSGRAVKAHTRKPFKAIRKNKGGFRVIAKSTGKPLSKHPLSHSTALAQLRAVEAHKHGG